MTDGFDTYDKSMGQGYQQLNDRRYDSGLPAPYYLMLAEHTNKRYIRSNILHEGMFVFRLGKHSASDVWR